MSPSNSLSRPRRMRRVVVLPHPDGPISDTNVYGSIEILRFRTASTVWPSELRYAFRRMLISNGVEAPTPGMSVQRLHDQDIDREHNDRECEAVAEDSANVEELEIIRDRVADAVWSAQQLHDKDDLPDESEAGSGSRDQVRLELRKSDVPQPGCGGEAISDAHLVEHRVKRSCSFSQDDRDVRELIQGHGRDRGHLGEPEPEIAKHGDDESRGVQNKNKPYIESPVEPRTSPECDTECRAQRHGEAE